MSDIKAHKDWPNHQGVSPPLPLTSSQLTAQFNTTYEERSPIELRVSGRIPSWAAGVLYRTGIGPREIKTDKNGVFKPNHWFDAMAVVHRFQILPPDEQNKATRVVYNSRSTCDKLIEHIQRTGKRDSMTFGRKYDPCETFFKKAKSVFLTDPVPGEDTAEAQSMAVTLSVNYPGLDANGQRMESGHGKGIRTLCNKSDMSPLQMLDPETLEPLGLATQKTLHPDLTGPFSCAHARTCPVTGDVFNYNREKGISGLYRVFRVSAATGETSILAAFKADLAYIHSFFLTENYVILVVWNSFYAAGGLGMLWSRNVVDALTDYDDSRPARWYVVDRHGKGLVATYESDPFYCFHTVNAYEQKSPSGGTDIVADLIAYNNIDCLKSFFIDNLVSTPNNAPKMAANPSFNIKIRRFNIPSVPDKPTSKPRKVEPLFASTAMRTPELPVINPHYTTRKHRFVYGVRFGGESSFIDGLAKFDVETQNATFWMDRGQSPGEPIFVPRPGGTAEDDGVLLTVVLDGLKGKSYLLVLDAKSMSEVARADVHGAIGFGFHGTHVSGVDKMPTVHT